MKTYKLLASAVAGLLLAAASASAQIPAAVNDVVVAFSTQNPLDGTGATVNMEMNLGTSLQTDGPGTYSLGNISANLTSVYGSSWATNSALTFGAAGWTGTTLSGGTSTVYATGAWTSTSGTLGVQNSVAPYASSTSLSGMNITGGKIATMFSSMSSGTALDANTVSIVGTGSNTSWDKALATGLQFGKYNSNISQAVTFNNGTIAAEDLYKFSPSAAPVFLGTLSLDTAGNLSFTVVPEPSTYAAILGVMTMGIVMIRRRRSSAQLAEIA
jgi:hypothetical protein